jgi:dinuclear metal center YbgI/SA1388 family protein
MTVEQLQIHIDSAFPMASAMSGDPVGIHVDSRRNTVARVLTCLDVTDKVISEAVHEQCDTIVAFHPLIYSGLQRVLTTDRIGNLVRRLIEHDIALICVHTAFDAAPNGTNALLCSRLEADIIRHLVPSPSGIGGMGLVARVHNPCTQEAFAEKLSDVCGSPVRWSKGPAELISTIAVVGGSGMSFVDSALASGVDAFITADVRYHGFFGVEGRLALFDPGHYEMEQFVVHGLADILSHLLSTVAFVPTTVRTSPVQYTISSHRAA